MTVVRFIRDCDISPCNFERARGPSQRAGIKYGRDRDTGGYLWDREVSRKTKLARDLPHLTTCYGRLRLAESQPGSGVRQLDPQFRSISHDDRGDLRPQTSVPFPSSFDQ